MNKLGKSLLVASLCMSGAINADTSANKTFLGVRPSGVNLAMEGTTWHTQVNTPIADKDDRFGASIQAVGFYEQSANEKDLGKYFGFSNKRSLVVGSGGATGVDIDRRQLIHSPAVTNGIGIDLAGTINLSVDRHAAGVRFDYQQDLDGLVKGMYFKVRAPIVWEETKVNLGLSGSVTQTIANTSTPAKSIADYFSGNITQSAGSNQQAALAKAKINSTNRSETCLGDIDVLLGWSFWESEKHHAGINVGLTIPTSDTPDGVFVFEPTCGNRGHVGLGAGFDAKIRPWVDDEHSLEVEAVLDWRYLFEDNERRTLGVKGKNWAQYMLVGKVGTAGVFPAANVLNQKVDVRPGHQVDARFALAYRYENFTADLGYKLYAREGERTKRKETWDDTLYGFAGNNYDASAAFANSNVAASTVTIGASAGQGTNAKILATDLDVRVAETPAITTHTIYGGLGYAWNEWDTPVMVGIGGSYEFASDQKHPEQWGVWGKLGVSF